MLTTLRFDVVPAWWSTVVLALNLVSVNPRPITTRARLQYFTGENSLIYIMSHLFVVQLKAIELSFFVNPVKFRFDFKGN